MKKALFMLWLVISAVSVNGQTATSLIDLFNTGETVAGSTLLSTQGKQVQSTATAPSLTSGWYVTYASSNGGSSVNSTFMGDAYAITGTPSGYAADTSNSQWIIAPGATTDPNHTTGTSYVNKGGNYLPGNGTGTNEGIYAYTLMFDISGTGTAGTVVTSPLTINMTIAADDGYTVYMNPDGYNSDPTNKPSSYIDAASVTNIQGQWNNTTNITLANSGVDNNSIFYIGDNYLTVVVDNTNSISGPSSATTWNQSGFDVFDTSAFVGTQDVWSEGRPIPEPRTYGLISVGIALAVSVYFSIKRQRQRSVS